MGIMHPSRRLVVSSQPEIRFAESLAIWTLRSLVNGKPRRCSSANDWGQQENLRNVGIAFEKILIEMAQRGMRRIRIGARGSSALSKDEQRLLRALAAAQSGDDELVDNYLYKLALDRDVRRTLASAVTAFGASLAVSGYWLRGVGNDDGSRHVRQSPVSG
jgi:hypothetical protein